ncbi:hypothetical protein GGI02_000604 [Coemansia sp. RSA 2322]|nr:hypothetical protein GGI02_000604 [Coemansia sp. RSA 2322]
MIKAEGGNNSSSGSASNRGMSEDSAAMDTAASYMHDDDDDDEEDEEEDGDDGHDVDNEDEAEAARGSSKQARLMRACDTCRRKKVKCNGTKPSCSHCTRMKLACHYSPLVRKKRVRRSIIDKLEERLESMEQMLQPLVERLSPNDPVVSAGASGFGLGFAFAPALLPPLPPVPQPPAVLLPPPHVVEELVEIAATRLAPSAPPVSWPRLQRRLRAAQLPEFVVYACVAFAARFSSRPEFICTPRYNAGRDYARRAAELVAGLVDRPDPDVIFCLGVLSLYEWGCGRGESAWTYTGMATRLAQRCRLHLVDEEEFNENAGEQDRSWVSTEWRRRLWWHVYCGDRTSVIVASRPATMHDDDCVVDLPTHDHEWVMDSRPSASDDGASADKIPDCWWLVLELYRICSRVAEFANRRRRPQRSSDTPRRAMFDILDRDLNEIRSKFVPCMADFPPKPELLSCAYKFAESSAGLSNVCSVYFSIHLIYCAARIILYRSELPEYHHESIGPELIERAKRVCIDSAHQQAEVIRWALDSVPIEDWDPKVGVWSLQGASIHVNAALSGDNAVAEQSRRDLEVHLKLHVASDQYYHFNMAIITMLHHVFNLRKKQRLAMTASGSALVCSTTDKTLVIQHQNDPDPWIVPRCCSFLGFTYNYSQLRGILNDAIKQTTYSPPDAITDEGTYATKDNQHLPLHTPGYQQSIAHTLMAHNSMSGMSSPPPSHLTSMADHHRMSVDDTAGGPPRHSYGLDLSGGLWHPPPQAAAAAATATVDDDAVRQRSSSAKRPLNTSKAGGGSAGRSTAQPPSSSGQPTKPKSGPKGGRKNAAAASTPHPPQQPLTAAEQLERLQKLDELRARVVLLQQLRNGTGGNQQSFNTSELTSPSSSSTFSTSGAPVAGINSAAMTHAPGNDVNGFLSNFAASIGSTASQLESSSGGTSMPSLPTMCSGVATQPQVSYQHPSRIHGGDDGSAWMPGSTFHAPLAEDGMQGMSNEELQILLSQIVPRGGAAAMSLPQTDGLAMHAPDPQYSAADIQGLLQRLNTFNSHGQN